MHRSSRLVALLVLSLGTGLNSCQKQEAKAPPKPAVPVTIATATLRSVPLQLRAIGTVEAFSTIQVKAQIGGELIKVHFQEGKDVKKGDLLFEIDSRPYQQALRQAEANLQRDLAQVKQAEANVARDRAQSRNAEAQAARYASLMKEGVVSREQHETVRTSADALNETMRADTAALDSANATVVSDRAAVDKAKLDLSYCTIRSPVDGRTGNLAVKEGNLVKANADTAMVVINQVRPIYASFAVPEQELASVRRYMDAGTLIVEASIPPGEMVPERGKLSFIDNIVDSTTGTIRLKATFENAANRLWPGQFINVTLTLTTDNALTTVPNEAVQSGQKGPYGYVLQPDNTVQNRQLTVGRTIGREIVILSGIQAGEKVITEGHLRLVPGAKVEVVSAAASAPQTGNQQKN